MTYIIVDIVMQHAQGVMIQVLLEQRSNNPQWITHWNRTQHTLRESHVETAVENSSLLNESQHELR